MIDHLTFRVSDLARIQALRVLGYGHDGRIDAWFLEGPSDGSGGPTTGCHLAWRAPDHCGAFVIDPDGNNVEVISHDIA
jgi:catechol 2,3-dioxygenase-like lactoylglutathione lyase family enzyme